MSIRTPPQILPKSIYGIPLIGIGVWTSRLPRAWVDTLLALLRRTMIGDLSAYGLPSPTLPMSKQYAINNVVPILYYPFVEDVRAGRIKIIGTIQKIANQDVEVLSTVSAIQNTGGTTTILQPDVIVAGTGFRTGFSELIQVPGIINERGKPVVTSDQEFPQAPRMYFIGQVNPLSGQLNEIRQEAGKIARKLRTQLSHN